MIVDQRLNYGSVAEVDKTFNTDHYPVTWNWATNGIRQVKDTVVTKNIRELHKLDETAFIEDLKNEKILKYNFVKQLNICDAIHIYNFTLIRLIDKQCPVVTKRYREKHTKSKWYNSDLQKIKQLKRQA